MYSKVFPTFQHAFKDIINYLYHNHTYNCSARKDQNMLEQLSMLYRVLDPTTFKFEDESLGRISYDYAEDFYSWMMSGCTVEQTNELKAKYPKVSSFLEKPKSPDLPSNFNSFYGPRILEQLPKIKKELVENINSRRAVINILQSSDLDLLDKHEDSNLEYPCCDSASIMVRDNKLNMHVHMRSNNMGNVAKLDMYLWGRFQCELAEGLGFELGHFTSTIVSAHIFDTDFKYFQQLKLI